ncbi:CAP-Gly domain-containing protein [Phlyctema vagabunda]|uniref:CAP-Gly domain-containing protein n=1 Tax=Phlyctema vagabunda TaxID=108571 RepID=A0ABR4PBW7_9HELO
MAPTYRVGQRLSLRSQLCTIRYVGPILGTTNQNEEWLGVEWDDTARGKHDGSNNNKRYFECRSSSKTAASFLKLNRLLPDPPQSFVEAVHQKYATEITNLPAAAAFEQQIMISGSKVAEEVGFDKIRNQLAQLHELKIVLVDGLRIDSAEAPGKTIREICPKIVELDLSRNLFESCLPVAAICEELDDLRTLRLNGNRFEVRTEDLESIPGALDDLLELELDETLLSWEDICSVAQQSRSLKNLSASSNGFQEIGYLDLSLPRTEISDSLSKSHTEQSHQICQPISTSTLQASLTSLTLEYNSFKSLESLKGLASFHALEKLNLKGNQIYSVYVQQGSIGHAQFSFGSKLQYVDLSYNAIKSWDFVDSLKKVFPGLTALRLSKNPLYENTCREDGTAVGVDDSYMLTIARLGDLKNLNYSNITAAERTNAEMFYLSLIGKAMGEVPENDESIITSKHRRYQKLCELYGPPAVSRTSKEAINPDFLEARLIKFNFYMPQGTKLDQDQEINMEREIPKAFDVYRVKGLVGRMFSIPPFDMRLIWETGEWDPVAGFEEGKESDEADGLTDSEKGKWMKREVEIEESTRQVGFCIDGLEARIRIEMR